jgi:ubiquinone/menaquinone biosynthesis C-methylase UbiE
MTRLVTEKDKVKEFWNKGSCGEDLFLTGQDLKEDFLTQLKTRYEWEPEILEFAQFESHRGKKVLEIGVGLGADHQKWAEAGVELFGIDLTERAIENTRKRFELFGLKSNLQVADAENLPFPDNTFDVVYSWGVLLYCPDMYRGIAEVHRVLKPGGTALVMLYQTYSFVGYMLWLRYGLFRLRPLMSLKEAYHKYLESEGTQAFTVEQARDFFSPFNEVDIDINLCHGDLLTSQAGQRHRGLLLSVARRIWPRWIIKKFFPKHGLFMKIRAVK